MTTVFTIGYQGKSTDDLCQQLVAAGVQALVDVRDRAWSYRPEYRKNALREKLAQHGIEYVHCREAGNPFRPKQGEKLALEKCAQRYRGHLKETPTALTAVQVLVTARPVALFCYEHEYRQCHRGVLVEELTKTVPDLEHRPLE